MGQKIALMYLDVTNLGDLVIYETAKYIIEDILKKNQIQDYELIPVDIGSFRCLGTEYEEQTARKTLIDMLMDFAQNRFFARFFPNAAKKMLKKIWHLSAPYRLYIENEKPKLEGVDMIIFGGGGLIKFHRQNFHYFLDDVIHYAQERSIPVLLNAQGIEGYRERNLECLLLKDALNHDCVKYISTRDDFAMLRNCYVENPKIVVRAVCDPAFWTSETYGVKKHTNSGKVGINVIRTRIFGEYMYKVSREFLGGIYYELIEKLLNAGYSVELFSNGVYRDTDFIDWLLEQYPDLQRSDKVTVANPASTKEFVQLLAGYDRFLAVRLHSAIIGTVLGVPNVSLVWNRKQILFGEETGLRQNFITKESFDAEHIFQCLCDAKPYEMDESYKMSVYRNLEEQMKEWGIGEKEGVS